ncbi:MAG TPA: hypothetical protein EYH31_11625, partial [Anaerolineae bacterium]|nr:hypothetical protein [Anaerolineae bacterium]
YSILRTAFFAYEGDARFDPRADFDEDNFIGIVDFTLLSNNYFRSGDIPVASNPMERMQKRVPRDAGVDLRLVPALKLAEPGQIFSVNVQVTAGQTLVDGVEAVVNFAPALLQVVDENGSPSTTVEGMGPLEELYQSVDNTNGQIVYTGYAPPYVSAPLGTFLVARIRFKLLQMAPSVDLSFDPVDTDVASGGESVLGNAFGARVWPLKRVYQSHFPTIKHYFRSARENPLWLPFVQTASQ